MRTAFGILLFVIVYAPIAFLIYNELTGRRTSIRPRLTRSAGQRSGRPAPQLTSG